MYISHQIDEGDVFGVRVIQVSNFKYFPNLSKSIDYQNYQVTKSMYDQMYEIYRASVGAGVKMFSKSFEIQ